jgi:hypothetical protein
MWNDVQSRSALQSIETREVITMGVYGRISNDKSACRQQSLNGENRVYED